MRVHHIWFLENRAHRSSRPTRREGPTSDGVLLFCDEHRAWDVEGSDDRALLGDAHHH